MSPYSTATCQLMREEVVDKNAWTQPLLGVTEKPRTSVDRVARYTRPCDAPEEF